MSPHTPENETPNASASDVTQEMDAFGVPRPTLAQDPADWTSARRDTAHGAPAPDATERAPAETGETPVSGAPASGTGKRQATPGRPDDASEETAWQSTPDFYGREGARASAEWTSGTERASAEQSASEAPVSSGSAPGETMSDRVDDASEEAAWRSTSGGVRDSYDREGTGSSVAWTSEALASSGSASGAGEWQASSGRVDDASEETAWRSTSGGARDAYDREGTGPSAAWTSEAPASSGLGEWQATSGRAHDASEEAGWRSASGGARDSYGREGTGFSAESGAQGVAARDHDGAGDAGSESAAGAAREGDPPGYAAPPEAPARRVASSDTAERRKNVRPPALNAEADERLFAPKQEPKPGRAAGVATLLVALTVVPAVALALPDTTLNVVEDAGEALELQPEGLRGLLRATGLSLPALLLAVPPAAVAARKLPARPVLLVGLLCLMAGVLAAPMADSVAMVAVLRAAQGVGAGIALPAALVLVWERRSVPLTAAWAGILAAALLTVMPLALHAVPVSVQETVPWHRALAPSWIPAVAAFGAALLCLVLRDRGRRLPPLRHSERGQLVLPLVPAAGFAFLALMTTYDWSPGGQLVVAGAALPALLGLALVGSRDATAGSPFGCAVVMVTVGLFGYPVTAPLAGLTSAAAQGRGEPGLPLEPFAAAGLAALLGALATARLSRDNVRTAVLAGHGLVVVGVLLGLATDAGGSAWMLLAPLVPLGAGLGAALAASLREAGVGAALFGLALCFPAVLTGQLLVLSLQVGQLERVAPTTEDQRLYGLVAGYRVWLIVAGVLALILVAAWARITAPRAANAPAGEDG